LVNQSQQSGNYKATWDGTDNRGDKGASGTYFYRLEINNFTITKKAVYIK
jgi:flagellar hook assembly protein FlgD